MKILLADKMAAEVQSRLSALGAEIVTDPSLSDAALTAAIAEHDPNVLVVRSTKVRAEHLEASHSLALIIRAGAGVNTIDLDTASTTGIYVANCPGRNAAAVAELTLGHMLNADRRISDNAAALKAGQWGKGLFSKGARGLKGRHLGIIGLGAIGQEVMQRARAFGMHVHAFDPVLTDGAAAALGVEKMDSLVALASAVDVLTVHVGLNEHTRGMIDAEVLGALAPGSIFINTSRGEIVDETALAAAVLERGIRAGLDVFCDEPKSDGAWHSELAALDGVYGTHHIGASTAEASDAVGAAVIEIVETWIETGTVLNCVNLALGRHASHLLVVRHKDEVGVLAGVLNALSEADINVQEMDNTVFRGAKAACAHIQLDAHPGEGLLKSLGTHPSVFAVEVVDLEET